MADTFTAQVEAWVRKTDATMVDVFRESTRELAGEVALPRSEGGNLPVVTGRLRRSLAASTSGLPPVQWRAKDFPPNEGQIEGVIASAEIGQTIYLGFQAPYATRAEQKNGFVRLAAQRWKRIVDQAAQTVKGWTGS